MNRFMSLPAPLCCHFQIQDVVEKVSALGIIAVFKLQS